MTDASKILDAVKQLDPNNDNHWTADGLPRLETVRMLASDAALSRDDVEGASPGFKRSTAQSAVVLPAAPAAPAIPAAPLPPQATGPAALAADPLAGPAVPPVDVEQQPVAQPEVLPTAPPADGLPTELEPVAVEGASSERLGGMTADDLSPRQGPGGDRAPEIEQGATGQGVNTLNSEEDDLVDALATVAPNPNRPTTLGGPIEPGDLAGVTADSLVLAAPASGEGEAQLHTLDRGYPGDPDAIEALEKELAEAERHSDQLKEQADALSEKQIDAASNAARIRAALDAARPRTGNMQAIQDHFANIDQENERRLAAQRLIRESGVDLKALGDITKGAPIDEAAKQQ